MKSRLRTAGAALLLGALFLVIHAEGAPQEIFVNLENGMPDRFASTDELVELAKTVRELGGYYDTHQRSVPDGRDAFGKRSSNIYEHLAKRLLF